MTPKKPEKMVLAYMKIWPTGLVEFFACEKGGPHRRHHKWEQDLPHGLVKESDLD